MTAVHPFSSWIPIVAVVALACSAGGGDPTTPVAGSGDPSDPAVTGDRVDPAASEPGSSDELGDFGGPAADETSDVAEEPESPLIDPGKPAAPSGVADGEECSGISQQAQNRLRPVDIIWAVDTSGSMTNELVAVQDNLNVFANKIIAAGIDAHVVLVAKAGTPFITDIFHPEMGLCIGPPLGGVCPGLKAPIYQHVDHKVASRDALSVFLATYPEYKGMLRKDSIKYFSVVSDDESTMPAADFEAEVAAIDPGWFDQWKMFGIFCQGSCPLLAACAATGNQYKELIGATGGTGGDLCGANAAGFAPVFDALATAVTENVALSCEWDIPAAPPGETFEMGKVNVALTPSGAAEQDIFHVTSATDCDPASGDGWYYDDDAHPTKVQVCPSTCDRIQKDVGAKIDVEFGCETREIVR